MMTHSNDPLLGRDELAAARGIGIILVVFGHLGQTGPIAVNVYGFHMPLFFFLAGMTLQASPPLTRLLARDGKSLALYMIVHCAIFAALTTYVFRPMGFKLASPSPFAWETYLLLPFTSNGHHIHLFLIAWFLMALLFVRLLAVILLKWLVLLSSPTRGVTQVVLSGFLGWLGMHILATQYAETKFWLWNLSSQVAVGTMFCLLGHWAQHSWSFPRRVNPLWGAGLFYVAYRLLDPSHMEMSASRYPGSSAYVLLSACVGIAMIVFAAGAFKSHLWLRRVGLASKAIMSWHLTVFATINLALLSLHLLQPGTVSVFTSLQPVRLWPLYVALAVALPLALSHVAEIWLGRYKRLIDRDHVGQALARQPQGH